MQLEDKKQLARRLAGIEPADGSDGGPPAGQ
jgi:hypothetical protein